MSKMSLLSRSQKTWGSSLCDLTMRLEQASLNVGGHGALKPYSTESLRDRDTTYTATVSVNLSAYAAATLPFAVPHLMALPFGA